MFTGHLAIGIAGKSIHPKISLGTWMTAAMLADLFAFVFMIRGIERFRPVSGVPSNRMLGEVPYRHRLLMDVLWAVLFAAGFFLWRRSARGAWLAAVILVRATKKKNWLGLFAFWLGIALLTVSWLGNITAGIDPNPVRAGVNGLVFFSLMIAWAYWMNRARYFKTSSI